MNLRLQNKKFITMIKCNPMKKNILCVAMIVLPLLGHSQSLFDKFEDYDEVTSIVVSEKAFELLARMSIEVDDAEAQDFVDIATSLNSLKVFTTEDKSIATQMKNAVDSYLGKARLTELMRIKDKDADVKFYIREGKDDDHVRELLMFVNGIKNVELDDRKIETVLLTLTGDIDLNKISALTQKMNLPEELNKAGGE